jgi:hypothetical protein
MSDPTYVKAEIDANPIWRTAFWLSEIHNDGAPIGWSRYIPIAESLQDKPTPSATEVYGILSSVL